MKALEDWEIVRSIVDLNRLSASGRELLESVYLLGAIAALGELDGDAIRPVSGRPGGQAGGGVAVES